MALLLSELVRTSALVRATRSRKEKRRHLSELLSPLSGEEVRVAVAYLSGDIPGGRIQVGPALLHEARKAVQGGSPAPAGLELADVQNRFRVVAETKGAGSKTRRLAELEMLLAAATEQEQEFLVGLVLGELRQGALEGVMAEAVADAVELPAAAVRRAAMLTGDLAGVAALAFRRGAEGLAEIRIEIHRPLQPMLAKPIEDVEQALETLGRAAFEAKLDGARVQIHKAGSSVRVFTRSLNDVTERVPEIVETVGALRADELILDGEVLALHSDGRPLPFQVTMRRFGRRLDVKAHRRDLPLSVFLFDALAADGEEWLDRPLEERWEGLRSLCAAGELDRLLVPRIVTESAEEARAFLQETLQAGHEGVMAKALDAPYAAGSRGNAWLKIKPAHTLDLVVLAAEWGSGRRRGWLSNLHLGARAQADEADEAHEDDFVMLGKTFKGLTDELLTWQTKELLARELRRDRHVVHVRPELVVEIAVNELQESSHYPGGLALRFARVKRYRPDKQAAEADSMATVRAIYEGRLSRR